MNDKSAFCQICDEGAKLIIAGGDSVPALLSYISSHESDIALSLDDYGELKPVFRALFGREPEE